MPSPSARRAAFLEALPEDLQVRVLACLSTKERAGLPLVCKAFNALANAPGSLLWETLDLCVTVQHKDAALQSATRRLLRARGQRTVALRIDIAMALPKEWCSVFATLIPTLCPQLQKLVVRGREFLNERSTRSLAKTCRNLVALNVRLRAETLACVCNFSGLTHLRLLFDHTAYPLASRSSDMQPLQALTQLRILQLYLQGGAVEVPACLPSRLLQLEVLWLEGCEVHLPDSFSKLQVLTGLRLGHSVKWANFWPAVLGLPSLRELDVCFQFDEPVPPVLPPAAFSTSLTGLTCWKDSYVVEDERNYVAGGLLSLPALRCLKVEHVDLGPRLDWSSLSNLQGFTGLGHGHDFDHFRKGVHLVPNLTCLVITEGEFVDNEAVVEFCRITSLRMLQLENTVMTHLPECMSRAHLNALVLKDNWDLSLDTDAYLTLESMSSLQSLRICVCEVPDQNPATEPQSLAFLRAISSGLDACESCKCHSWICKCHTRQ